jgi:uncharacterized protein with ATP-grasp and redox domains
LYSVRAIIIVTDVSEEFSASFFRFGVTDNKGQRSYESNGERERGGNKGKEERG